MKLRQPLFVVMTLTAGYVAIAGCGDDDASSSGTGTPDGSADRAVVDSNVPPPDARSPEYTGSACTTAADCYGTLGDGAALKGEAVCIDKVDKGYCTHKCQTDADCCAVPGECRTGLKQVCASFENTTDKYCFLSCEDGDIGAANDAGATDAGRSDAGFDGEQYCRVNASNEFGCRSTGGGVENRKACLPIGGGDGGAGDGGKKDSGLLDATLDVNLDAPDGD